MNYGAAGSNAFAGAVQWLDGTLTGTLATAVAIIAVASLGLLLLSGRIDTRRAGQVLLGCFILFGASSIAAGIVRGVNGSAVPAQAAAELPSPVATPLPVQAAAAGNYDPYAGAALPSRR